MLPLHTFLSLLSGFILLVSYIPYAIDIIRGKVRPARSTRLMFVILLFIALLQQYFLGSSWILTITAGELVGSLAILGLALKYGVGGLLWLDVICYGLLALTLAIWGVSNNTLLALHLTIVTDLIAFTPTLVKTWRYPESETSLFFAVGTFAPLLGLIALDSYVYAIIAFPLYLALVNGIEVWLIYRLHFERALLRKSFKN